MISSLDFRVRALPHMALLRTYLLISFLLFSPSSAFWLKFKWTDVEVGAGTTIDGSLPANSDCHRIKKPASSPSDSQVEAVSVLNGYDYNPLQAMGIWLDPNCEGDPDVFIGWITDDQTGVQSWQVVDLSRIGGMMTAVAKYNGWKPITAEDLGDSYAPFNAPAGLQDGGYVILEGETDQILRSAPLRGGGEGPIVQYGTVDGTVDIGTLTSNTGPQRGKAPTLYDPGRDMEGINILSSPNANEPIGVNTNIPPARPVKALVTRPADLSGTGQSHLRVKDKSMPALGAARDIYDRGSTSNLINQIERNMLQGRPNTEFIRDYEAPLPKEVADSFRKSLEDASFKKGLKQEEGQNAPPPVLGSLAEEEALRRVGVSPANSNPREMTINDYLLGPSFWPELYRVADKDPYETMGIVPENLQADYWNALQSNAANGNPTDMLPAQQLSGLIENRMFGESRDNPGNVRPKSFRNQLPNPFPSFVERFAIDRSELEEPKAWADDPTQHPTYKPPAEPGMKIEAEPEAQVPTTVQTQGAQAQGVQAPAPVANTNAVPEDPFALQGDFLMPQNEDFFKFRFRRH
ncbi:hypothetical protein TWF506_004977 [Arthrobotrys conoides]|uniref:Uncharacterized protein n=1 Tax=Arthrobotrys conoides TaxID=74498 RepID=A0AAN8RPK5_9PEZI